MHVSTAQERLREHWAGIPSLPYSPTFDGSVEDLRCLDYLQYEGIPYAAVEEIEVAGMFWGHVFARLTGCAWGLDEASGIPFLKHAESSSERFRIYPTIRIREVVNRSCPQFGKLSWAMSSALFEFSQYCYWETSEETEARIKAVISGEQSFIDSLRESVRELKS